MTSLHKFIAARQEAIIEAWLRRIQEDLIAAAVPTAELRDHVPLFLHEITLALRDDSESSDADLPASSPSAAEHGVQRLRLGFDLSSVVREYGALHDCIMEAALAAGVPLCEHERQVLSQYTITGIAEAVSEYAHQRDAELQRLATEHLAFVAHELRNPLFSTLLAYGSLRRKGLLPDVRAAQAVQDGLTRMQELIDRTLKVARAGSGVDLRPERVSLRALLEGAQGHALAAAEDQQITLTVQVEPDVELVADLRLLRSAIENLVYNAIKFTHPQGAVCLRGKASGTWTIIEVEDECGGLPPHVVEKVFSPFIRGDAAQPGFGLGLAIVRQAIEAHGGSVRVQDLTGKGCIFILELPTAGRADR